jgi:hypothetical protein
MIAPNIISAIAQVKAGNLLPIPAQIGDIIVGALTGLSAPSELDVTKRRMEDGFDMTIAAVDVSQDLVMDICLTNPSLSVTAASTAAATGNVTMLTSTWREKRDYLHQIQSDRELVNVITHEGWYTNMLVRSIDPAFDVDENYDCYFATVTMTEARQVPTGLAGLIDSALETKGKL